MILIYSFSKIIVFNQDPKKARETAGTGGPILVLTGPAGTGKTAVLRMLAKEMDLDVVEWINSVNENNLIRRAGLPDQDDSKMSDSVDDGQSLGTLNSPTVS